MQILHSAKTIFFWLTLLFAAICCHGKDEMLKVVVFIKHPDFVEGRIKTSQTFPGFRVTIGCRSKDGTIKTMGSSEVSKEEKFKVFLPSEAVRDGVIRKECYAQVHSASDASCPLKNNQEAFKIIFQYKNKERNTVRHSGKLTFSPISCTSKFLWPFHHPKLTKTLLTQETPLTPSFPPSNKPVSTLSPPQPEHLPPAINPAKNNPPAPFKHPLPLKNYPPPVAPALTPSIPKSKQPPSEHKDFSPAPVLCFDPPSPLPDESSPLGPSANGNEDFPSGPSSGFDTPASPLPNEPLPLTPSPNANKGFSPAPSIDAPASPLPEDPLPSGPSPGNEDYSPTPAPSFDKPTSPIPDESLPLAPSNNGNIDLSPAPAPSFDTLASPLPAEPSPSPSPLVNNIPFPPHIPSFIIPRPPPIPSVNMPSPPAS